MAKQPAFNGIDYTPRRPAAIAAKNTRPLERHVHGVIQRQQRHPLFEVTAAGKSVEFTDLRTAAHSAFNAVNTYPKQLSAIYEDGRRVLLDAVLA